MKHRRKKVFFAYKRNRAHHLYQCFNGQFRQEQEMRLGRSSEEPPPLNRRRSSTASRSSTSTPSSSNEVHYLPLEPDWFNIAGRSFECTKPMLALRVYSMLHVHGEEVFARYVDAVLHTSSVLAKSLFEYDHGAWFSSAHLPTRVQHCLL